MWARVVEVMLGCWLGLSPFIFRHPADAWRWWANDFACALAVIACALLSLRPRLRQAHLATGGVALWLIGFGYLAAPHPPALQNDLLVGLLLAMCAVVPNEANQPPPAWRKYYAGKENKKPPRAETG